MGINSSVDSCMLGTDRYKRPHSFSTTFWCLPRIIKISFIVEWYQGFIELAFCLNLWNWHLNSFLVQCSMMVVFKLIVFQTIFWMKNTPVSSVILLQHHFMKSFTSVLWRQSLSANRIIISKCPPIDHQVLHTQGKLD